MANESPLPLPTPHPAPTTVADELDVYATLRGVEPGWYRSVDLLPRYVEVARRAGHTPVDAKKLGEALHQMGVERRRTHNNLAAWYISPALAGR